jgi:hypothetical protein
MCAITIQYIYDFDLRKCKGNSNIEGAYPSCLEEGEERIDDEYAVDGAALSGIRPGGWTGFDSGARGRPAL